MQALTSAISFVDSETGRQYTVRLVKEGATTDDWSKRFIAEPVGWRDGRLAFMFSDVEGDPHEEARHVGNLFNFRHETFEGRSWVFADLDWDNPGPDEPERLERVTSAKRLVDEDRITGVSISPSDGEGFLVCGSPADGSTIDDLRRMAEQFNPETCDPEEWIEAWANVIIGSATLLVNPAFEDAEVVTAGTPISASEGLIRVVDLLEPVKVPVASEGLEIVTYTDTTSTITVPEYKITVSNPTGSTPEDDMRMAKALAAAADLKRPPASWFTDPQLTEPTALTIDDEGKVAGHLALWSTCHRGFDANCVTPPQDATDYAEFHDNARVMLDTGELLGVGCLTVDVSHADVRASAEAAKRHYDHSGTTVAQVRAGQDDIGVWVAGAVVPWATPDNIEKLRRLSLSGDWRPKGGSYFLIAAQAVPVPGFPIRAKVASGIQVSLTTVGPANDYDPEQVAVHAADDEALIASAVQHLVNEVRALRAEITEERRLKEYAKAQELFAEVPA